MTTTAPERGLPAVVDGDGVGGVFTGGALRVGSEVVVLIAGALAAVVLAMLVVVELSSEEATGSVVEVADGFCDLVEPESCVVEF